ncbi:hypothetical protein ACLB1R_15295 [Escherichia coli]
MSVGMIITQGATYLQMRTVGELHLRNPVQRLRWRQLRHWSVSHWLAYGDVRNRWLCREIHNGPLRSL